MKTAVLLLLPLLLCLRADAESHSAAVSGKRRLDSSRDLVSASAQPTTCDSRGKEGTSDDSCSTASPAALPSTHAAFPGAGGKRGLYKILNSSEELETVNNAVKSSQWLYKLIIDKAFPKVLDFIGEKGGPIAGGVTSILKFILAGASGGGDGGVDSASLMFAKKSFAEINDKLESFTNEFHQVKEQIDWSAIQVSYGTCERSVRALRMQLQLLVEAPSPIVENMRQQFIAKFESDFQGAAEKIFDGIVSDDMIFARNLLEASAKFTRNHRSQVQTFSMGLVQLLLQAVQIQVAYFDLKYANQDTTDYIMAVWKNRTAVLTAKMESFDKAVTLRWETQVPLDADQLIHENKAMSNHDLALKLYAFLAEKYNWRWFGVVVYDGVTGRFKHAYFCCEGYKKLEVAGKNVIFSSIDKEESTFDRPYAIIQIIHLDRMAQLLADAEFTLSILKKEDDKTGGTCKKIQLMLVIKEHSNPEVVAATSQFIMRTVCDHAWISTQCYDVVLFG